MSKQDLKIASKAYVLCTWTSMTGQCLAVGTANARLHIPQQAEDTNKDDKISIERTSMFKSPRASRQC